MPPPEEYRPEADEDEDEEEAIDDSGYKTIKDAVLFAIDVSRSMLTPQSAKDPSSKNADTDSPTLAALKCAYQLMQQRIISHPNDMMGILLFGTEKSKFQGEEGGEDGSVLAYPHCYLLSDLDVPAAGDVKRLRGLVNDGDEGLLVPSQDPVSMANVLFAANQIFTTRAANFSSRRLFLVTDNDDPHAKDKALRSAAAVRAKDLYDLGVVIELFPISTEGHSFDRAKFYDDIVYRARESDPEAPASLTKETKVSAGDGISLLQSLLAEINSKAAPRRALFSLPFELGPGLKIGVKGYITIKRQEHGRTCYVWLGGEKAQIATLSSTKIAEDTARAIEKVEVKKAYRFGGDQILFTPEELKEIRNFGDPIIRVIGFKPLTMLPVWANCRAPIFVYPAEEDYVGSTRVFSALFQSLRKQQKMAVCWCIVRRNAVPILAALIPTTETDDDDSMFSQGLWLIQLPFADDLRKNPDTHLIRATDPVIDGMRTVVEQLMLPKGAYDPHRYPNPALQWHYKVLQAIALDEDMPEQDKDKTLPAFRQIAKRAGPYVLDWGLVLEEEFQKYVTEHGTQHRTATATKRSAGAAEKEPAKKVKTEENAGIDSHEMKKHFEGGTLSKLKVAELKQWLTAAGIKATGAKKQELVDLVERHFDSR